MKDEALPDGQWLDGRRIRILDDNDEFVFSWHSQIILAPRSARAGDIVASSEIPPNGYPRGPIHFSPCVKKRKRGRATAKSLFCCRRMPDDCVEV
jgi:hypothetical protein